MLPPRNHRRSCSVIADLDYEWGDGEWMASRGDRVALDAPMSIYELHLGSWGRHVTDGKRFPRYDELADPIADHVLAHGFTHVEFLPIMEHPFYGSWGYQTTGFFAPSARYGTPHRPDEDDRPAAPARRRRDPRLGAVALPQRQPRPLRVRRHPPVRARRPAPGLPPRLELGDLQLQPQRSPLVPHLERRCAGSTGTTSTVCASTPSHRCCTSTTRATRASGSPTSSAAARTSTRSCSCAS